VANEEYRVERRLLTTRVFHGGQRRLNPAPDLSPASERWPGHRSPWQPADPPGLRYRIEEASVYDAETGERLTWCRSGTPLA